MQSYGSRGSCVDMSSLLRGDSLLLILFLLSSPSSTSK